METVWPVITFALGLLCGAGVFEYAFRLSTRYQRTGHIEVPAPVVDAAPMPANPEAAAHRRVLEDAVTRGADDILAIAEAAGDRITRDEAERQAREIMQSLHGASPMGGTT